MRKAEATNNLEVSSKEGQTQQERTPEGGQAISLTVEHLQGMFIVFFVGSVASLFIFSVEMILAECTRRWT